jgi:hypothetical protein
MPGAAGRLALSLEGIRRLDDKCAKLLRSFRENGGQDTKALEKLAIWSPKGKVRLWPYFPWINSKTL